MGRILVVVAVAVGLTAVGCGGIFRGPRRADGEIVATSVTLL